MKTNMQKSNQLKHFEILGLIVFTELETSFASITVNDANGSVSNSTLVSLNVQHVIPLKLAQQLVTATQSACANQGFPITVSVLDRHGVDILLARGDGTTGASVEVARDKAYAAVGFNNPTSSLEDRVKTMGPGILSVEGFTVLPGGLPIRAGDELVGGLGVSGAPGGEIDENCAEAGLQAILPSLSSANNSISTSLLPNESIIKVS